MRLSATVLALAVLACKWAAAFAHSAFEFRFVHIRNSDPKKVYAEVAKVFSFLSFLFSLSSPSLSLSPNGNLETPSCDGAAQSKHCVLLSGALNVTVHK